ncbi:TPA: fimbrial protein [Serratia fonticola]|uniref:fimbrial protein n=1 Tax=Serratia fonticola TaxID=47917 RepID=UPI002179D6CD|nr:fimbrial protein [Serratia fonticola]CAI1543311.1 putative minor fimbrial subunit StfF [Serratia fonticola]CAI1731610.1 putative minor fimbrial subunit StfF [Serratia fonticola]CAI1995728.1 putative minor fimbrial subunit StfF [Serratia fonticola]CAI2002514.1 putative minor fimbrial subunit StfF [Serratia fonticola]
MAHDLPVKALLVLGALFSSPLLAADNLLFRGTLIEPPPCKINDGATVDVDFGERVGVNKVDGVNYLQALNYRISCEPGASGLDMTLTLRGQQTGYDTAAVRTNLADLGIRVLQNGKPFTLNQPIGIDPKNPPRLEAVPVKNPGATLKEGAFVATATLQANYQ